MVLNRTRADHHKIKQYHTASALEQGAAVNAKLVICVFSALDYSLALQQQQQHCI